VDAARSGHGGHVATCRPVGRFGLVSVPRAGPVLVRALDTRAPRVERQLREDDEVGRLVAGSIREGADEARIAGEITDGWVDLCEGKLH